MDRSRCMLFVSTAIVAIPAVAFAQNARVVAADGPRILDVLFDPPTATQLNTDAADLSEIVSLAFRDDGANGLKLFAADAQRGKVLLYTEAAGVGAVVLDRENQTHPLRPDALALDLHDNLFGATSLTDSQGRSAARVWVIRRDPSCTIGCLPGGYAPEVGTIDGPVEITVPIDGQPTSVREISLDETRMVPFNRGTLGADDLLVLGTNPPALLRYPRAAIDAFLLTLAQGGTPAEIAPEVFVFPSYADVAADRRFPEGFHPTGMEFTPYGNLLVSSKSGSILVYRPDGTRLSDGGGFVDFATGLPLGQLKVAVGPQDGQFRAFVADSTGGAVLRFRIEPDGTGTPDGSKTDPWAPIAVATTTSNRVPTPPGPNVQIQVTNLMTSTIENVGTGGTTSGSVVLFEDPREFEVSTPPDQPLHRPLLLSEIRADLPDAVIPEYVRAFRKDDPVLGRPTFVLVIVDTDIQTTGVIDHVIDEALVLGYEPDCDDLNKSAQQRLFWLPNSGEAPVIEGAKFIDISNDCGTSRGRFRTFSLFLASARDTRPSYDIAKSKLIAFRTVVDQSPCIDGAMATVLHQEIEASMLLLSRRRFGQAINRVIALSALIQATPEAFENCTVNIGGELRARADSAVFILRKLPHGTPGLHW